MKTALTIMAIGSIVSAIIFHPTDEIGAIHALTSAIFFCTYCIIFQIEKLKESKQ